jgi:hypothetical protein
MRLADFTLDEYKIIVPVIMTLAVGIFKIIRWCARVDYDLDNFGKILNTEKAKSRLEKEQKK